LASALSEEITVYLDCNLSVTMIKLTVYEVKTTFIIPEYSTHFQVHAVHLDNYQSFLPTDAQVDSIKNNFKFALKLILKSSHMFRYEKHHHQGAHYLSVAKVTIVKMS
jgi:hypothetical protein